MNDDKNEIMLDLLCKQAVYGLTEEETKELAQYEYGSYDLASLEMTVSSISLINLKAQPMPDHVQARLMAAADDFFAKNTVFEAEEKDIPVKPQREVQIVPVKPRGSFMDWFGWAVAAAACVVLAVNLYSTRNQPTVAGGGPTPTPTQEEKLDPALQRKQLIDSSGQVIRARLGKGNVEELADVSGDVAWSDANQAGYLRVKGLPVNDATKETYQLWIFDETQDKTTPINGGTFDVNAEGEILIPINADLKTRNPSQFAITIEKPGGVVVSKQKKVAALAAVKADQS